MGESRTQCPECTPGAIEGGGFICEFSESDRLCCDTCDASFSVAFRLKALFAFSLILLVGNFYSLAFDWGTTPAFRFILFLIFVSILVYSGFQFRYRFGQYLVPRTRLHVLVDRAVLWGFLGSIVYFWIAA